MVKTANGGIFFLTCVRKCRFVRRRERLRHISARILPCIGGEQMTKRRSINWHAGVTGSEV